MSAPVFQAEEIFAGYGGGDIVMDVSLTVAPGELVVLLGPNGAGKSTLLKAVIGLVPRSAGRLTLRAADVSKWPTERLIREGMAYIPQLHSIFPSLTVMENLEMGGYALRHGVKAKAAAMLDLFPALQRAAGRPASTLSGGERSLLGLARGLMIDPAVLLADEPTAGLSPKYQQVVWEHLSKIAGTGVAVLVVEQNVAQAVRYAHRGYVLVLGRIAMEGPAADLMDDRLAALYIGSNGTSPSSSAQPRGGPTE